MSLPDNSNSPTTPSGEQANDPTQGTPPSGDSDDWTSAPITTRAEGDDRAPDVSSLDDVDIDDEMALALLGKEQPKAKDPEVKDPPGSEDDPEDKPKADEPKPEDPPKTEEPPKVEDPKPAAPVIPPPPDWKTAEDVDLDAAPEAIRPWMQKLAAVLEPEVVAARTARAESESLTESLRGIIGKLTDKDGKTVGNPDVLADYITQAHAALTAATQRESDMAQEHFLAHNPDFRDAPTKVKVALAKAIQGGMHKQFEGSHLGHQLAETWKFVKYKEGWTPQAAAPKTTPVATAPAKPASPAAPAQPAVLTPAQKEAAVAGRRSTSVYKDGPVYTEDGEIDVDASMAEHAHLLRK